MAELLPRTARADRPRESRIDTRAEIERTYYQGGMTPWGEQIGRDHLAPGIDFYRTGSHGGYRLSRARQGQMPENLRLPSDAGGNGWYEEDCQAIRVVVGLWDQPLAFDGSETCGGIFDRITLEDAKRLLDGFRERGWV